ncbi:mitochondrial 54s ribosomal protein 7 5 [Lasallia pustulata]|uniref:Mitochondrial 54s ribosomal protein 7 5 n=1 Tax=Lasallia pustulata TaxID=136370 RepID=A0A1W5DE91_9LECA|nr:mitochondrial 54s ribosomal protein 7 5 [Lasallia pustulata]
MEGRSESSYLHAAGLALQNITNVRATVHRARASIPHLGLQEGAAVSVSCDLRGEDMYCFLAKVVEVVMPRIKDYKGVSGGSGDGSGNLAFCFPAETVGMFPEIEINYDMYPPKFIPSIDVIVHTTATNDKDARLLLSSMGVPFHGRHIN